ncbi:MAG: hypothetical protein KDA51_04085 [Planctomycetales bacterium]|nr:hypothetical protein [Planctomycetales bacterium]
MADGPNGKHGLAVTHQNRVDLATVVGRCPRRDAVPAATMTWRCVSPEISISGRAWASVTTSINIQNSFTCETNSQGVPKTCVVERAVSSMEQSWLTRVGQSLEMHVLRMIE